jgi:hypothetical protein
MKVHFKYLNNVSSIYVKFNRYIVALLKLQMKMLAVNG